MHLHQLLKIQTINTIQQTTGTGMLNVTMQPVGTFAGTGNINEIRYSIRELFNTNKCMYWYSEQFGALLIALLGHVGHFDILFYRVF